MSTIQKPTSATNEVLNRCLIEGSLNSIEEIKELRKRLNVIDRALEIIDKVCLISKGDQHLHFTKLSVGKLGFETGAYYRDICSKALKSGLHMCQHYDIYPLFPYLIGNKTGLSVIAMPPNLASDNCLDILAVKTDINCCPELFVVSGHPGKYWTNKIEFIFRS
jgi:hypothetical protein